MTHFAFRRRRRKGHLILKTCQYLALLLGLCALGYSGSGWLDMELFQAHEARAFNQALERESVSRRHISLEGRRAKGRHHKAVLIREGSVVGRLEIPSVGLDAMVLEGDDARTLRRAVGHIPGTALPWQPGNVAIAGHRDTFFRPLRKIRPGDDITLQTLNGSFHYRVEFTRVVAPTDTWVLSRAPGSTLTLVTCYPFYYVGAAPERFVVRATRVRRRRPLPRGALQVQAALGPRKVLGALREQDAL